MSDFGPPILVTGAARSGTSMSAGIINICGAFGGNVAGATPHNKKGMFENNAIRNLLVKPYLESIGADRLGQYPLPDRKRLAPWDSLRDDVMAVMKAEGYKGGPWYYKGAKMCLLWPLWHGAFTQARWVIVRRRPGDIVSSCLKTPFMKAYKDEAGWYDWLGEHLIAFEEMHEAHLNIFEFWPEIALDDKQHIEDMLTHCGLEPKWKKINKFISRELYSHDASA